MFRCKVGLLAVAVAMQAILLSGCDAASMMRSSAQAAGGAFDYQRSQSSRESYQKEESSSESLQASGYQVAQQAAGASGYGGGSGYGGSYSSGNDYGYGSQGQQSQSQMMRSKEVTTTTTTTTTTTVRAVDYIQSNFQEVGSKSMGYQDDKDEMILKSFCDKENFLSSLISDSCNKKLITCELGLDINIPKSKLISYFTSALYKKERKVHRAALALKRCRLNTKSYHKQLVSRTEVLNHIGMTFTASKSNSCEMMKQWHDFVKYQNGLYYQSFFSDETMWKELANQIGYSGGSADDFKVYLLRNRFRKEKKTCKIAKCMRSLRKKHCNGKCAKRQKPVKRSGGCGKPGCGGGCGGGCGPAVNVGVKIGGGCGGKCGGKCGKCC